MAVDVNNWYRGVLGRDADQAGLAAWNTQLNSGMSEADAFKWFKDSANTNGEQVNNSFGVSDTYTAPKGTVSGGDSRTLTDEWAANNGVKLSAEQAAKLKSEYDVAAGQGAKASTDLYAKFLADNNVANGLDYGTASRFGTATPQAKADDVPGFNLSNIQGSKDWVVDPKTQTVAGQLNTILASDSPLMQQARTRALQQQNASGRMNTTMGQSAADDAMYDKALQIATPDAATYADAGKTNTASTNTFSRDGNAYERNLATMSKQNEYDLAKIAAQASSNEKISGIEAQYKSLTQGSASATSILMDRNKRLDALAANKDYDADTRAARETQINAETTQSLDMIGALAGNKDLASYIAAVGL